MVEDMDFITALNKTLDDDVALGKLYGHIANAQIPALHIKIGLINQQLDLNAKQVASSPKMVQYLAVFKKDMIGNINCLRSFLKKIVYPLMQIIMSEIIRRKNECTTLIAFNDHLNAIKDPVEFKTHTIKLEKLVTAEMIRKNAAFALINAKMEEIKKMVLDGIKLSAEKKLIREVLKQFAVSPDGRLPPPPGLEPTKFPPPPGLPLPPGLDVTKFPPSGLFLPAV